jgi:hypothetical protein
MFLIIFVLAVGLYFLPSFIAKGCRNAGAITTLNALAGWTFVGWIVAIVWAAKVRGDVDAGRV